MGEISKERVTEVAKKPVSRHNNVLFEFPDDDMRGTVAVRDDEMVIELPEQDGLAAALVIGKKDGSIYRGRNELRDAYALSISAAWCNFGDVYAGVWIEEGNELLFKFRLPK